MVVQARLGPGDCTLEKEWNNRKITSGCNGAAQQDALSLFLGRKQGKTFSNYAEYQKNVRRLSTTGHYDAQNPL
jgi:hypothetical protein